MQTRFGKCSIEYRSILRENLITAVARIPRSNGSHPRVQVRFRHPEKAAIRSVKVNGKRHKAFDAVKGDVDVTGYSGRVTVEVKY